MMSYFFSLLFMFIMLLVSVGFFTLLERKVLGYIQFRSGPNKLGTLGLLQPFSDGGKLFMSDLFYPMNSNIMIYMVCPLLSLVQSLFMWIMFPYFVNCLEFTFGLLFFLCCSSVGVYFLMICGWSSNSLYSILGCIRSISQAVSYEVSLSLILLGFFLLIDSYNLIDFLFMQSSIWLMFISLPIWLSWMSCCMAETNRSPFDFSEGESELVSGFNIEYGGGYFAFLFISEYLSIMFLSLLTCSIFVGSNYNDLMFYFKLIFFCYIFIWVRSTLPRFRYDKLMYLAWKCYLPIVLNYLSFFILLKLLVFYHFFL
nr:NADH dehydrogenase subunit 1 [Paradorydium reflexanum]